MKGLWHLKSLLKLVGTYENLSPNVDFQKPIPVTLERITLKDIPEGTQ